MFNLLSGKNHLRVCNLIGKGEILSAGLLNCAHHAHVKEDMAHQLIPALMEKVEFTETYEFEVDAQRVELDVFVFSPSEIGRIARDVNDELRVKDDTIKRLGLRMQACVEAQALLIPPPVYIMDTRFKEAEAQNALLRTAELVTEKRLSNQADTIEELQSRVEELEYSLKGIRQETVEALGPGVDY